MHRKIPDREGDLSEALARAEPMDQAREWMGRVLSPPEREVVTSRFALDYSLQEIADLLNVSVSTAFRRLNLALHHLQPERHCLD